MMTLAGIPQKAVGLVENQLNRIDHRPMKSKADGAIAYPDGSALNRPLDLPMRNQRVVMTFIAIAVVIAVIIFARFSDYVFNGAAEQTASVQAVVNRGVSLDLPQLTGIIGLSNDQLLSLFQSEGYTVYDNSSDSDTAAKGFDYIKLPADVSLVDAGIAYASGINSLSAESAAKYLSGSWRLIGARTAGNDFKLKYADFTSLSTQQAVLDAAASEGLDAGASTSTTVDSSGNTTLSGTTAVGGASYKWLISACPLSEIYSVQGLPDTAQYVSIRLYQ